MEGRFRGSVLNFWCGGGDRGSEGSEIGESGRRSDCCDRGE